MTEYGRSLWRGLNVGFTIIGTTIGAGFASGREIWEFFGSYGPASLNSLGLAMILFVFTSMIILWIGKNQRTGNYYDLLEHLLGKGMGKVFDWITLFYLLSMSVIMFAGSGATFAQWHLPFMIGVTAIAITVYIVVLFDVKGLMMMNTVIVPILVSILLYVSLQFIRGFDGTPATETFGKQPVWPSGVIYASLNILPLLGVLSTLGRQMRSNLEIVVAGVVCLVGLGAVAYLMNDALLKVGNEVHLYEIPLFSLLTSYPVEMILIVSLILWLAILTTAISGIYGIILRLKQVLRIPVWLLTAGLIVMIIPLSYLGFSTLVKLIYPIYGMINLFVLALLLLYPFARDRHPRPPSAGTS